MRGDRVRLKYIVFLVCATIALGILNASSFCYLKVRYVSNHELFEEAIAHEAKAAKIGDYSSNDTPASYLARHPNYCSIPVFQPTNSWVNFLVGYKIRYVRVVYRMPQVDNFPRAGDFYEAFVEMTPAGRRYTA
jgi:hypothetical protein